MSRLLCFGLVLAFMAASGCRQAEEKPDNLPPLFPFTATVIQDGKPLPSAFVRLMPVDSAMPWSCGATTDSAGNAVIKTIGKFNGVPAGKYKVLISKLEMPKITGTDLSSLNAPKQPAPSSASFNLVDAKYSQPNTTSLETSVDQGRSKATFDVGAAVHSEIKTPH